MKAVEEWGRAIEVGEKRKDREACSAVVQRVAKSRTHLATEQQRR